MAFRIQLRNDTYANWTEVNPILLQGEPAYENNTNRLKIGNGASGYAQLPYFYGNIEYVNGLTGSIGITGGTGINVTTGASGATITITSDRPYKLYTCNLNAAGTNNPTEIVLESDFTADLVWTRGTTGVYVAGFTGATGVVGDFGHNASKVMITSVSSTINSHIYPLYIDADSIQITQTGVTGAYLDGLSNCFVEIKVY
jgi:hypothetical protein